MPETEVKERTADLEDVIVAAYKRGASWAWHNPGDGEFLGKAARDYADFTMHADPDAQPAAKAVNSFPKLVDALKAIIACDDDHEVFDTFGLADSTDNNGKPYPSQHLADVLAKARTALSEAAVVEDTGEGRATLDAERSNTKEG
jgi:hypothetical protein